jgi:hypothetical protein
MADGWARYGVTPYGAARLEAGGAPAYAVRPQVATVEAAEERGQMTARLAASSGPWLVRRITVSTPGSAQLTGRAYVYVGEPAPEALVMGTRSGALDVAVEDPPLYIPEGTPLVVRWDAGPTRALARIEYQEA